MISFRGLVQRGADGWSRRSFLQAGVLAASGLSLSELLRREARAGIRSSEKAVIQIHLDGGPPQMDTIDLKPQAPVEVRGEFQPIATRLPGFAICEWMPRLAQQAQDFVFLRSLVGAAGQHDAFQCQSGFEADSLASIGGRPALGCVLSQRWGTGADTAPTFVDLMQGRPLVRNSARPGFLGPAHRPFRPDISALFARPLEEGMKGELARLGSQHSTPLTLGGHLDADRLDDRRSLLQQLDQLQRRWDSSGMMQAMDRFEQQAASILTSGDFAKAMDFDQEDPATLKLYTPDRPRLGTQSSTSENETAMRKLLLARRLVEAGVRCVSVSFSDFDTHSDNFRRLRHLLPILDHGLCALVTDLRQRGMLDDVSIVVWGEFGRTPKINAKAGRDHWPRVAMGILAGGGIQAGQVIGATDRSASTAVSRPVHYQDVLATLYHNLGIDAARTTIPDTTGRPQYLLDRGQPIAELV